MFVLALELPGSSVNAVDVSPDAVAIAMDNAARLGAEVDFHESDGLELWKGSTERFDFIVSNPPYIDPAGAGGLPADVRDHEPPEALFAPEGEPDHWAERLVREGLPLLRPGGALFVELGFDQAPRLRDLFPKALGATYHADLAGIERVLEIGARSG